MTTTARDTYDPWVGGMPVGVQLMGQQHDDARITAMARWLLETVPPVVVR
jgi:Asp-tRNA(Asn)/Glu-tRNA(Gln) amidotransferase A subunit family amidase